MPTPLKRVFEVAGCRTQAELADFWGIKQSSISDAKKRERIPAEWLLTLWRKKGVNPDWILTGQGPRSLQPTECMDILSPVYIKEIQPPEECSTEQSAQEIVRRALGNIKSQATNADGMAL